MQALIIRIRRRRLFGITALMVGLGVLGIWLMLHGRAGERVYGSFLVLLPVLSLPNLIRMLFDSGPRIIIDDSGIEDRSQRVGAIPWNEIVTASLRTQRSASFISLQLRNPDIWLRKMSLWRRWIVALNRSLGYSEINLNLSLTDADPGQVLRSILQHTGHLGPATPNTPAAIDSPAVTTPTTALADLHETIPVRFSPTIALESRATNTLRLTGRGTITFTGSSLRIQGKKNRFFGVGASVDFPFQRDHVVNLFRSGRLLKFDIVSSGAPGQSIQLWAHDETTAMRIAAALPALATEEAIRASAEIQEFQTRLAAVGGRAWVTPALVVINIAVFVAAAYGGAGIMTPNAAILMNWGTNYGPLTTDGQWWRLLTSVFLHFGLIHLLFNMWALYASGRLVERLFGSPTFLMLYFASGMSGSLCSLLWHPATNSAGASGAIFGVYGAMVAFFLRKDTMIPLSIVRQQRASGFAFIGYNLLNGISHQGIDNAAHIGGLLGGFVLGYLMARPLDADHRTRPAMLYYGRGLATAAAVLGALYFAVVNSSAGSIKDQRLRRDIAAMGDQEHAAVEVFNESLKDSKAKTIDDKIFAERLEKGVLPLWQSMAATIEADQPDPGSKLMSLWTAYRNFIESRRDAFSAYDEALRNHDSAKMQLANAKFLEGKTYMQELKAVSNR